jgi:uncharacterized protein (DUF1684 family)
MSRIPVLIILAVLAAVAAPTGRALAAAAAADTAPTPARRLDIPTLLARPETPAVAAALPEPPVALTAQEADTVRRSIEKDRADTEEWLRSKPTSYLATVSRRDFGWRKTLSVGSGPGNDVRIQDPSIEPRHLRVTVVGDSFRVVTADPAARFRVGTTEVREATLGPSTLGVGRFSLRLSHQRFPALIVFDPRSPRFKEYKGLRYFPVDLGYRYVLRLTPNPRPDTVIIMSTRGNARRALRVGWFDFLVGRTACRLAATRLLEPGVGEHDFGVFFRDSTTGIDTYPVGRYVDPEPLADGRFILDFNFAYNPACAFSDYYNCPIPPRENRLPVAIRAGEMDSHYH